MRVLLAGIGLMGVLTAAGQSVPALRQAAHQGDGAAALALAEAYTYGSLGLAPSPDSAARYLRAAALAGHPDGQYLWGTGLLAGKYPAPDRRTGVDWLIRAAAQRQLQAHEVLVRWFGEPNQGTFGPTKPDSAYQPTRALFYATQGAALGSSECAYYAALAYHSAHGTPTSDSLALGYLTQAANAGHRAALNTLATWYLTGATQAGTQPQRARTLFLKLHALSVNDLENRTYARVGLHGTEQLLRRQVNTLYQGLGWPPQSGVRLPIRP